jgi:small subunit ribosomal protein S17e
MGRIRGRWIKNISKKLVEKYPGKFGTDFKNNNEVLKQMGIINDKVVRNKIAGYIISVIEKKNA